MGVVLDGDPQASAGDFADSVAQWSDDGSASPLQFAATGTDAQGNPIPAGTSAFVVSGTHAFAEEGTASAAVTINDDGGQSASGSTQITVADASISVSVSGPSNAVEGKPVPTQVLGQVSDTNPNATADDFRGTIDWENNGGSDANISFQAVANQPGVFNIIGGGHTCSEEGGADMVISISDHGASDSNSGMFDVADAAISLSPAGTVFGSEGQSTGMVTVATLTDQDPNAGLDDYPPGNVVINWGDGTSSNATLAAQGSGTFLVQGSKIYDEEGPYDITVTATDFGGSAASPPVPPTHASIQDAAISVASQQVGAIEALPTGVMTIGTLTDTNSSNTDAMDFGGTYTYSDGSGGLLQFVNLSPGTFAVKIPSNTFQDEGTVNVSYTAFDFGGAPSVSGSTPINVAEGAMGLSLASDIIQGSTDGRTNLTAMTLTTHNEPGAAWALVMSQGDDAKVDVWATATPGPNDQPLLGLVNGAIKTSTSWAPGVQVPTTLYVGAYHGSSAVGDIDFALGEADANGTQDARNSDNLTAVRVRITSALDPNSDGLTDLTDQTRKLLVGQLVHDTVTLEAPAAWQSGASYSWGTPAGTTLYSYTASTSSASSVSLSSDNGPLGGSGGAETGLNQKDLAFFWVTVPSTNPTQIQVAAKVQGQTLAPVITTVNVQTPTVNYVAQPKVSFIVMPPPALGQDWQIQLGPGVKTPDGAFGDGFSVDAQVKLPDGYMKQGKWTYLQLVNTDDKIYVGASGIAWNVNGTLVLDSSFPLNVSDPNLAAIRDDASTNNVTDSLLDTGPAKYTFHDNPGQDLSATYDIINLAGQVQKINIYHASHNDAFNNYIMFKPPGDGSSWVPLKLANWAWNYDVVQDQINPSHWTYSTPYGPPTATSAPDPTSEPTWPGPWQGGGWKQFK